MAPRNIVISLDGATFSIPQNYLNNNQLDSDTEYILIATGSIPTLSSFPENLLQTLLKTH